MSALAQLVVGPRRHGVVQFGLTLHAALRLRDPAAALIRVRDSSCWPPTGIGETPLVHTQFTDRLFGATPQAAADTFTALAEAVCSRGSTMTATLHDLPQPSDGNNHAARVEAYRVVAGACDAVTVSSRHERNLLHEASIECDSHVIPLPLNSPCTRRAPRVPGPASVGVFGYVYPGKGHREVLDAAQGLAGDVEFHVLGGASAGHEDLIADLRRAATRQRRSLRVTGHIPERHLMTALQAVTVPVAAHQHVSASGSLNTWLSAGRRPLAPRTRYTAEIERRNPECLQLFSPDSAGLRAALRDALRYPDSTWLPIDTSLSPSPAQTAAAYLEMFATACP